MTKEEIHDLFHYHVPNAEAMKRHVMLTEEFIALATLIDHVVEDSPGKTLAMTRLQEAQLWVCARCDAKHPDEQERERGFASLVKERLEQIDQGAP